MILNASTLAILAQAVDVRFTAGLARACKDLRHRCSVAAKCIEMR